MIRVVRGDWDDAGVFTYFLAPPYCYAGKARSPLLDACKQLKRLGAPGAAIVGLFREGRPDWDARTTVDEGVRLMRRAKNARP